MLLDLNGICSFVPFVWIKKETDRNQFYTDALAGYPKIIKPLFTESGDAGASLQETLILNPWMWHRISHSTAG